jgi:hypothetical protein
MITGLRSVLTCEEVEETDDGKRLADLYRN